MEVAGQTTSYGQVSVQLSNYEFCFRSKDKNRMGTLTPRGGSGGRGWEGYSLALVHGGMRA